MWWLVIGLAITGLARAAAAGINAWTLTGQAVNVAVDGRAVAEKQQ